MNLEVKSEDVKNIYIYIGACTPAVHKAPPLLIIDIGKKPQTWNLAPCIAISQSPSLSTGRGIGDPPLSLSKLSQPAEKTDTRPKLAVICLTTTADPPNDIHVGIVRDVEVLDHVAA